MSRKVAPCSLEKSSSLVKRSAIVIVVKSECVDEPTLCLLGSGRYTVPQSSVGGGSMTHQSIIMSMTHASTRTTNTQTTNKHARQKIKNIPRQCKPDQPKLLKGSAEAADAGLKHVSPARGTKGTRDNDMLGMKECLISGIPFALHIKNMRIFTIVPTATSAHYGTLHPCLVTTT
ncbi:hypothetical protein GWK47_005201 [Chionoecetes opilio]|uniref:Uncharacterized protein n=1 Tax=Chionoecetes opilio TaxID=41210 RepID=A0A8J4YBY0_CHIOP|nr:hypothetical protein GWK47_005201 [Chionoecetes opilio]